MILPLLQSRRSIRKFEKRPLEPEKIEQLTEALELTGSIIASDKPVGVMGGSTCMDVPLGECCCDRGEQMRAHDRRIADVQAGGQQRVGSGARERPVEGAEP